MPGDDLAHATWFRGCCAKVHGTTVGGSGAEDGQREVLWPSHPWLWLAGFVPVLPRLGMDMRSDEPALSIVGSIVMDHHGPLVRNNNQH